MASLDKALLGGVSALRSEFQLWFQNRVVHGGREASVSIALKHGCRGWRVRRIGTCGSVRLRSNVLAFRPAKSCGVAAPDWARRRDPPPCRDLCLVSDRLETICPPATPRATPQPSSSSPLSSFPISPSLSPPSLTCLLFPFFPVQYSALKGVVFHSLLSTQAARQTRPSALGSFFYSLEEVIILFFLSSHSFDIYCGLEPHYNYSHSLNSSPPRPSTSAHHSTCFPSTFSSPCSARWRPKHPSSGGTRPSLRRFLVGKTLGVTSETLAAVEATGETTVCGKPSYVMSMREHASNTYYRRWPGREWRKWRRSGGQWPR